MVEWDDEGVAGAMKQTWKEVGDGGAKVAKVFEDGWCGGLRRRKSGKGVLHVFTKFLGRN